MDTSVASGLQVSNHVATNRYELLCDQYPDTVARATFMQSANLHGSVVCPTIHVY